MQLMKLLDIIIYFACFNLDPVIENIVFLNEAQLPGTTQDHLQIFNIEAKAKIKSHQMPEQASSYYDFLVMISECCCKAELF